MKAHILILMEFDDHHAVYGVYDEFQEFLDEFKDESPEKQAELICCYDRVDIIGSRTIDIVSLKCVVPEHLIKEGAMDIIQDYEAN